MTAIVFIRLHCGGDFQDPVPNCVQAIGLVSASEEFGFHNAGPIGESQEFHRFAGNLVKETLFDDQAAGDYLLADVRAESIDRTIGIPGNIREKFKRMTAGRVAEEFLFSLEALEPGRFG